LAQEEGIRFFYTPEQPKRGDKVRLNATVLDKLGAPITTGKVNVLVKAPNGATESIDLMAENTEWGVHTGIFSPREGGKYEIEISNETAGRKMKSTLDVSVPTLEKEGLPARLDRIREIAAVSGGKFGGIGDLSQLLNSISLLPERKPEEIRWQLWCDPWWCGSLLAAFAIYWVGRKVGGLV
jgi:hypothetical protein